ncbi:hypothetical protein HMPREF1147_2004 [Selenomonas sp. FOBRC9]|nr:hypothetical protein HMPREF1147_2004 [Selenomonas sp. FOBRC9]
MNAIKWYMSRPARGAWIETLYCRPLSVVNCVAPRTGRVD